MLEKLRNLKLNNSIVVLNDFFLDRIIKIQNLEKLYSQVLEKSRLGGSIRGILQTDLKGGNATNVAYALARLGCPVSLITVADKTSSQILKETFSDLDKASLFIIDGKPGRTTSLELDNKKKIVNVMISDLGDNENFGPDRLGIAENEVLAKADAVIMTNWASNKKGTALSIDVFSKAKLALHFLDPADIQTRVEEFKDALKKLQNNLHSLCINENECNLLLKQYGMNEIAQRDDLPQLVTELSNKISIPVDLHTSWGAYWSNGKEVKFAKSFQINPLFVTGAGDVWDAANVVGYMAKLEPLERLAFANGAAALYVTNSKGTPPTMNEVLSFIDEKSS
jgi:ribokinase